MPMTHRLQATTRALAHHRARLVVRTRRAARAFSEETREATQSFKAAVGDELDELGGYLREQREATFDRLAPRQLQLAFLTEVDERVGRIRDELHRQIERLAATAALPAADDDLPEADDSAPEADEDAPEADEDVALPLPDYESLSAKSIVAKLDRLDAEAWEAIRAFEERHKARRTVLRAVDRRLAA